jgi:hypothetical protein
LTATVSELERYVLALYLGNRHRLVSTAILTVG